MCGVTHCSDPCIVFWSRAGAGLRRPHQLKRRCAPNPLKLFSNDPGAPQYPDCKGHIRSTVRQTLRNNWRNDLAAHIAPGSWLDVRNLVHVALASNTSTECQTTIPRGRPSVNRPMCFLCEIHLVRQEEFASAPVHAYDCASTICTGWKALARRWCGRLPGVLTGQRTTPAIERTA